jgi:RimJ/RimL family protein N-acetyltransferase
MDETIVIKHYHKNKGDIIKRIEHLNKMDYPLNLKRSNHLFVGFVNDKPVCFLGLNQRSGWYYFRGCYVMPEYRGRGFQVELMNQGISKLRELGINRVSSMVHTDNVYSLKNALKVGFEITGRRKENYHVVKFIEQ